jgi:hypothetical protein
MVYVVCYGTLLKVGVVLFNFLVYLMGNYRLVIPFQSNQKNCKSNNERHIHVMIASWSLSRVEACSNTYTQYMNANIVVLVFICLKKTVVSIDTIRIVIYNTQQDACNIYIYIYK